MTDGNTKNVESIWATAEYVCWKLAEDNQFIEDEIGGITLQNNNITPPSNIVNKDLEKEEDDEDPEDALLISNMKRYKINPLCRLNLVEFGWRSLGSNLEEYRYWSKMIQDKEMFQIKHGFNHYIIKQKKRRVKLKK